MNTIDIDAVGREKLSGSSLNKPIAVNSGRIVTFEHAPFTGVFEASSGNLPSYSAKSFRLTNASSSNIDVGQKQVFFSKQFEGSTEGLAVDSPSLSLSTETDPTPLGQSEVLKLVHDTASSAYHTVNSVGTDNVIFRVYFKIESLSADIQPIGLYTNISGLDINHPAAAIRVTNSLDIVARVGYNNINFSSASKVTLNTWHRASISLAGTQFSCHVEIFNGSSYVSLNSQEQIDSYGNGLLSELGTQGQYVIGVSSEGEAVHYVDGLEGFVTTGGSEKLLAGETKEYFCQTSLDEFNVSAPCSGYFRR